MIARSSATDDEPTATRELAADVPDAWRTEFIDADGTATPDTQATSFEPSRSASIPDASGGRGRLARRPDPRRRHPPRHRVPRDPFLLPVLADTGHLDVAYDLLFQDTEPSWLLMSDRGTTTIWEDWDGVARRHAARSLNHYSKGAVIAFLHRTSPASSCSSPATAGSGLPRPGGGIT